MRWELGVTLPVPGLLGCVCSFDRGFRIRVGVFLKF